MSIAFSVSNRCTDAFEFFVLASSWEVVLTSHQQANKLELHRPTCVILCIRCSANDLEFVWLSCLSFISIILSSTAICNWHKVHVLLFWFGPLFLLIVSTCWMLPKCLPYKTGILICLIGLGIFLLPPHSPLWNNAECSIYYIDIECCFLCVSAVTFVINEYYAICHR